MWDALIDIYIIGAAHAKTGNAPLQALLKIDLESGERQFWSAAPRGFVGEPIICPASRFGKGR